MRLIIFWLTAFLLYMGVASAQTFEFDCGTQCFTVDPADSETYDIMCSAVNFALSPDTYITEHGDTYKSTETITIDGREGYYLNYGFDSDDISFITSFNSAIHWIEADGMPGKGEDIEFGANQYTYRDRDGSTGGVSAATIPANTLTAGKSYYVYMSAWLNDGLCVWFTEPTLIKIE